MHLCLTPCALQYPAETAIHCHQKAGTAHQPLQMGRRTLWTGGPVVSSRCLLLTWHRQMLTNRGINPCVRHTARAYQACFFHLFSILLDISRVPRRHSMRPWKYFWSTSRSGQAYPFRDQSRANSAALLVFSWLRGPMANERWVFQLPTVDISVTE